MYLQPPTQTTHLQPVVLLLCSATPNISSGMFPGSLWNKSKSTGPSTPVCWCIFPSQTFWLSLNSQPVLPSSCWGCFCQHFLVHKWAGSRRVIHPPPWLQIINKAPASNLCLTVYLDYQWWHRRLLSTRPTRANQIVWYLVCCLAWPGPL